MLEQETVAKLRVFFETPHLNYISLHLGHEVEKKTHKSARVSPLSFLKKSKKEYCNGLEQNQTPPF